MRNVQTYIKQYWSQGVLVIVSAVFLVLYGFLYHGLSQMMLAKTDTVIFNQPDEMANYAFIKEWVLTGEVGIVEPLTEISVNQVHPRSMTVVQGRMVPIGFPGFIAVMSSIIRPLVWVFGENSFNWLVVHVTPFVAVLSAWLMYGIIRALGLEKRTALLGALLLLVIPPWWYYASRPLQTNSLFVFFILSGLWAGLLKNTKWARFFFMGISFGLALYVRPSEWLWVFGLIGVLAFYNRKILNITRIIVFGVGSGLMVLIFFLTQFVFYGSWLGSGYVRPAADGSAGILTAGPQGIYWVQALFLPFGFNALAIIKTMYHYGFKLFLPWVVTTFIGFGFLCAHKKEYTLLWKYTCGVGFLGVWLALYYGSWQFTDNLAGQVSIGSSQVRYFLPLYVLSIPLIAYLISLVYSWNWSGKLVAVLIVVALCGVSVKSVYFKFEGLVHIKQTVAEYYTRRAIILHSTPEHAIIVTRYADKYIFPLRPVITTSNTIDGEKAIEQLMARGADVYWFDYLNIPLQERLVTKHIEMARPLAMWDTMELREFYLLP